ncbi:FG-GAP-like repeat-containing protein [Flavobacteriaceae sp. LMIT009]
MKIKLLLLMLIFAVVNSFGQQFERVENLVGLGVLEENNGIAVADIDGDNDLDVFVVAKAADVNGVEKTHSRLFRNDNNGAFTDITIGSGLESLLARDVTPMNNPALNGEKYGAFWGDYNNDGFPDLIVTQRFGPRLFKNRGDNTFAEITELTDFGDLERCQFTCATWFDYDRDGDLDFYMTDWDKCETNLLFRNNGDDSFTDVTEVIVIKEAVPLHGFNALPIDVNDDGWMDLYVSNDINEPNYLYINNNGNGFTESANEYGLDNSFDDMVIAPGDYNLDGLIDFFITGIDENRLFKNNGDGTYSADEVAMGVEDSNWAWGAKFSDFDLDGDEDLVVVNGYDFDQYGEATNQFYVNQHVQGQSSFVHETSSSLAELTISVDVVDFDYDNDGDRDLLITNNDGPSYFYENKLINFDEQNDFNWFKLKLQGVTSNRDAVGASVKLTTSGGKVYVRHHSGISMFGQSQLPVHFGLGDEGDISEIEIKWPSGYVQTITNLSSRTTVLLVEGQSPQILNIEPSQKVYGCTDPNSCTYDPLATLSDGSCEYLDVNEISGRLTSGFLSTETYAYQLPQGSTAIWSVEGGEILSGQGTNQVTVRWHVEAEGHISVIESNGICQSLPVSATVQLHVNNLEPGKSIARIWNEALLEAIRGDYARPTVHARNLFHISVAMYDAWAVYDHDARPYFIGNDVHGFETELLEFIPVESIEESRKKAISYAAYRIISHRFANSPGSEETIARINLIMDQLGYDYNLQVGTHYEFGNAAALGNYIAQKMIEYGNVDGSREQSDYSNAYYEPVNDPMNPAFSGNTTISDPNRWQPLSLDTFIDQSGNLIEGSTPDFLSPEWGNVHGFALTNEDKTIYNRGGDDYNVFNDPSDPPYLDYTNSSESSRAYKWGFALVSVWGSHLDPTDGVLWDISPRTIGNIPFESLPTDYIDYPSFYDLFQGGDISTGHDVNPITGSAYEPQMIPRGDYARILAEFWADGPDSETPPGHWFTILNYVNDHPQFEKRFKGEGEELDDLEWDVKAYFMLAGTMHDAAISAWSIKGWYDYIRPVSAIRYMAKKGQSTDQNLSNFHPEGIPLIDNYIEVVEAGDPLAGSNDEHVGKIKLYTWKGHDYIDDTEIDQAGVDWILAENWWPYQRPSFVTPPFAGYVSGHSTYSRAAAEVMTRLTGTEFFPGGMGEFKANKNEFLVFEEGPSIDVTLQWATYRDASDQCSLSRIWGGIHPPADDIPGRIIGEKVGNDAFNFAEPYFYGKQQPEIEEENLIQVVYPNPVSSNTINITNTSLNDKFELFDITGKYIEIRNKTYLEDTQVTQLIISKNIRTGIYILKINGTKSKLLIVE